MLCLYKATAVYTKILIHMLVVYMKVRMPRVRLEAGRGRQPVFWVTAQSPNACSAIARKYKQLSCLHILALYSLRATLTAVLLRIHQGCEGAGAPQPHPLLLRQWLAGDALLASSCGAPAYAAVPGTDPTPVVVLPPPLLRLTALLGAGFVAGPALQHPHIPEHQRPGNTSTQHKLSPSLQTCSVARTGC
jgi:hypothetical protein